MIARGAVEGILFGCLFHVGWGEFVVFVLDSDRPPTQQRPILAHGLCVCVCVCVNAVALKQENDINAIRQRAHLVDICSVLEVYKAHASESTRRLVLHQINILHSE